MTELVITKGQDGKLEGLGEKGRRAYTKFRKIVDDLAVGETMWFAFRMPRSPQHHRYFFKKVTGLFERQEQFSDFDRFMDWVKVGAGFADLLPGRDGQMVAIPKSLAWEKLEEQDFIEFHRAMTDFFWTSYAQAALWPALTPEKQYVMVDRWHRDFQIT